MRHKYTVELEVDSRACLADSRLVSLLDRIIDSGIELAIESDDHNDQDVIDVKQLWSVVVKKVIKQWEEPQNGR